MVQTLGIGTNAGPPDTERSFRRRTGVVVRCFKPVFDVFKDRKWVKIEAKAYSESKIFVFLNSFLLVAFRADKKKSGTCDVLFWMLLENIYSVRWKKSVCVSRSSKIYNKLFTTEKHIRN